MILTLFFALTAIVCALGWLFNRIALKGVLLYTVEECGRAPIHGELGPYMKKAVELMFLRKSK